MDLSNMLVWNIRGMNKKSHRDALRNLIGDIRSKIVSVQETKINQLMNCVLLSALGLELDQHVALPAQGTRGRVLIAWRGSACHAITTRLDTYSVSVLFQSPTGHQWWLTGVYGPPVGCAQAFVLAGVTGHPGSLHWPLGFGRRFQPNLQSFRQNQPKFRQGDDGAVPQGSQ